VAKIDENNRDYLKHFEVCHIDIISYQFLHSLNTIQLPQSVSEAALSLFDGLGFTLRDYGFLSFMRGHNPVSLVSGFVEVRLVVQKPATLVPVDATAETFMDLAEENNPRQISQANAVFLALKALKGSPDDRLQLILLRMQCAMLVLQNSKTASAQIQGYLDSESSLFPDILALADYSSDSYSEISSLVSDRVFEIASKALAFCSLLVQKTHVSHQYTLSQVNAAGILGILGTFDHENAHNLSQDCLWQSFLLNAFSAVSSINARDADENNENLDAKLDVIGHALELFNAAASVQVATSIGTIIGLLSSIVDYFAELGRDAGSLHGARVSVLDAACQCMEALKIDNEDSSGTRRTIFREYEGLKVIEKVIELFASYPVDLSAPKSFRLGKLLELSLAHLSDSIASNNQGMLSAAESGASILQKPMFCVLMRTLLHSSSGRNHISCWYEIIYAFYVAIDVEPQFLGLFLDSEASNLIPSYLVPHEIASPLFSNCIFHVVDIFDVVGCFAKALSITERGRTYLVAKGFHLLLIDSVVHQSNLCPVSEGLSFETLQSIGSNIYHIMRSFPDSNDRVASHLKSILRSVCSELIATDSTDHSMTSKRMQQLQKLTNICTLTENLSSGNNGGGSRRGEVLKEIIDDYTLELLIQAYRHVTSTGRTLLVQLGKQFNVSGGLNIGFSKASVALNGLLKSYAQVGAQFILPILFKFADQTLGIISATKLQLKALQETSGSPGKVFGDELERSSSDPMASASRRRKQRGSSFGSQGANVFVLGVLDAFPNVPIFSSEYAVHRGSAQEETMIKFISSCTYLEWLSMLMASSVRPGHRLLGSPAIVANKDVLRRLFAFYDSSLLEVSRFMASSKLGARPVATARAIFSRTHPYHFSKDEDNVDADMNRTPKGFVLQVVARNGALVREGAKIESSRAILLAPIGTEFLADDRCCVLGNIPRYRTAVGWISEFTRNDKDTIVQLLDVINDDDSSFKAMHSSADEDSSKISMMTLRETASYAFERVHVALKLLSVNLAHSIVVDTSGRQRPYEPQVRGADIAEAAPTISSSLAKIIGGCFTHAMSSLGSESTGVSKGDLNAMKLAGGGSILPHKNEQKLHAKAIRMKSGKVKEEVDLKETISVDFATFCLYHSIFIRQIFLPLVKDRKNYFNTFLMHSFAHHGIYESSVDVFAFIVSVLKNDIEESLKIEDPSLRTLGSNGRCALLAICPFIELFSLLTDLDSIVRAPITNSMSKLSLDKVPAPFHKPDFIFRSLHLLGSRLLRVHQKGILCNLQSDVIDMWLDLVGKLQQNLQVPLPDDSSQDASSSMDLSRGFGSLRHPASGLRYAALVQPSISPPQLPSELFNSPLFDDSPGRGSPVLFNLPPPPPQVSLSDTSIPSRPQDPNQDMILSVEEESLISILEGFGFDRDIVTNSMRRTTLRDVEGLVEFITSNQDMILMEASAIGNTESEGNIVVQANELPVSDLVIGALVPATPLTASTAPTTAGEPSPNVITGEVRVGATIEGSLIGNVSIASSEAVPTKKDEISEMTGKLVELADSFRDSLLNVVSWLSDTERKLWDALEGSKIRILPLIRFLSKFRKTLPNFEMISFFLEIDSALRTSSTTSREGMFYFLLHVLQSSPDLQSEIRDAISAPVSEKLSMSVSTCIIEYDGDVDSKTGKYPNSLLPAVLILNELCCLHNSSPVTNHVVSVSQSFLNVSNEEQKSEFDLASANGEEVTSEADNQTVIFERIARATGESFLVGQDTTVRIFHIVERILSTDEHLTSEVLQATLILLSSLTMRGAVLRIYCCSGVFAKLLSFGNSLKVGDSRALISLLLTRYVENERAQEYRIYQTLKKFFFEKVSSSINITDRPLEHCRDLKSFLGIITDIIAVNPDIFSNVAVKFIRFIMVDGRSFVQWKESSELHVDRKVLEKAVQPITDLIVSKILSDTSEASPTFSQADLLNSLADNILSHKPIGKHIAKHSLSLPIGFPGTLMEFIFAKIFPKADMMSEADAAARLLIALSSCGPEPAKLVFDLLIFYLKWYLDQSLTESVDASERLRAISRVSRIILFDVKKARSQKQVFDNVESYLACDIHGIIFSCLQSMPAEDALTPSTVDGLLAIVEVFTRPSTLNGLKTYRLRVNKHEVGVDGETWNNVLLKQTNASLTVMSAVQSGDEFDLHEEEEEESDRATIDGAVPRVELARLELEDEQIDFERFAADENADGDNDDDEDGVMHEDEDNDEHDDEENSEEEDGGENDDEDEGELLYEDENNDVDDDNDDDDDDEDDDDEDEYHAAIGGRHNNAFE